MANSKVRERRFDGEGQNPNEDYRKWKKWAIAYIIVLKAKKTPLDALGPILYCLLDGQAVDCLESHDMDVFNVEGGDQLLQCLAFQYRWVHTKKCSFRPKRNKKVTK